MTAGYYLYLHQFDYYYHYYGYSHYLSRALDVFENWHVSNLIDIHLDPQTVIVRFPRIQWLDSVHSVQHHQSA